jgi:2-oxoglutarate ferredoxin oxidoreductase subunit beta
MTKGQPSPTTETHWSSKLAPQGTGLSEFHPMAIALAAGANFIARGFTGDPNGLADLIVQGVRTPGFSFIEVLSPCITFRPEQKEWKKLVRPAMLAATDDTAQAARQIFTDDGMNLGVLFAGARPAYQPPIGSGRCSTQELEAGFAL